MRFTLESMPTIFFTLRERLRALEAGALLSFEAPDPDRQTALYDGEVVEGLRHRGLSAWVELAAQLGARLRVPVPGAPGFVRFTLCKLGEASWHARSRPSGDPEKYGSDSAFARISKFEDPAFVVSFRDAIGFVRLPSDARVLELGCNQGEALRFVARHTTARELLGIDHSDTAISAARDRFPDFRFETRDLTETEDLGQFDLVVAINVLHSPSVDDKAVLQRIVQAQLKPGGGVILGFPNSRHIDRVLTYGAKVKGHARPELSVLHRDVGYCRRYLHQHRFVVTVTGKHTVLVTGRRLDPREREPRKTRD